MSTVTTVDLEAWAEAEAAFGGHEADWRVLIWPGLGRHDFYAEVTINGSGEDGERLVEFASGNSPSAALQALTQKLRGGL